MESHSSRLVEAGMDYFYFGRDEYGHGGSDWETEERRKRGIIFRGYGYTSSDSPSRSKLRTLY